MTITEALKQGKTFVDIVGNEMKHVFTGKFPAARYKHIFIGKHQGLDSHWHAFVDDSGASFNIHTGEAYDKGIWVYVKKENHTIWTNCYMRSHGIETGVNTYDSKTEAEKGVRPETESSYYIGAFPLEVKI